MSTLIVIAVLAYAIKVAVIDGCYAVRGQVPPRLRARLARAAKDDAYRVRYGAGDYLGDLWDYAFTALRARQARRLDGPPRYGLHGYLGDRWDRAWRAAGARHDTRAIDAEVAEVDLARDPGDPGTLTPEPEPAPTGAPDDGDHLAPVIPIHIHHEEEPMSTNTTPGEVTGLATAHGYAAGMSAALAEQAAHTEQFMATLTANQVTGEAVTAAAQAQELSNAAAAAWATAQDALARHMQVTEAYAANPDAGSKEFVTAE